MQSKLVTTGQVGGLLHPRTVVATSQLARGCRHGNRIDCVPLLLAQLIVLT